MPVDHRMHKYTLHLSYIVDHVDIESLNCILIFSLLFHKVGNKHQGHSSQGFGDPVLYRTFQKGIANHTHMLKSFQQYIFLQYFSPNSLDSGLGNLEVMEL